jgi:hypothetical protein
MAPAVEIVPTGPGNTLVIPTPQDRLIEPYQTPFLFGDFSGCLGGVSIDFSCNCVFHDANTHLMFTVASCGAGAGGCVTGNIDLIGGCAAVERCQARVDAMAGVRLDATEYLFDGFPTGILNPFPAWLLGQLSAEQIALGYIPDWWAVFCDPLVITIPGFSLRPPPAKCGLPDTEYVNGLCPAGFFADPLLPGCCKPLDPPIPAVLHNLAGATRSSFAVPPELYGRRRILSSTRFEPSVVREAPPPPLPAGAIQPLPPGNCGCSLGTSEEIDEL